MYRQSVKTNRVVTLWLLLMLPLVLLATVAAQRGVVPHADAKEIIIGDTVWFDRDSNGVQDDDDAGIAGVVVGLYPDLPFFASPVATTTTDSDGYYSFSRSVDSVTPETDYVIRIDLTQPALAAFSPTVANNGADDELDSDGVAPAVAAFADFVEAKLTTPLQGYADYSYDFGFTIELGTVGNYVWLDEDADGVQDRGERGIANVVVEMVDQEGQLWTTTTDALGGYRFADLMPGSYTVRIPASNFVPSGPLDRLAQTPQRGNPSVDFGNQDDAGYAVVLGAGDEDLSADFGYAPNPDGIINNQNASALGDRIWIDSDGDGMQDSAEIGVRNAEVTLYYDPDGNGIYDTPYTVSDYDPTLMTDANGVYLFTHLPAGSYVVKVTDDAAASHAVLNAAHYIQTGDPDHFGALASAAPPASAGDHQNTIPIVLAPGDVYLNLDFGYQPQIVLHSVGDTVWLDADADGNGPRMAAVDGGEPVVQGLGSDTDSAEIPIPHVSVALIADLNGSGTHDGGEPIIATTFTNQDGQYLFDGLSDGQYIVWVTDSNSVLHGLKTTFDADGTATPNWSAVNLTATDNRVASIHRRDQDFGYTPASQAPPFGLIGDTVYLNKNGDGVQDADEPGIEGVIVQIAYPDNFIKTTTTNENGSYWFPGLAIGDAYTVTVLPSNFAPGGALAGLAQTADPDGALDNVASVTLTAGQPINLDQDFGYTPAGNGEIGNLVWHDVDADGLYEPLDGELPIGGVTVALYRDHNGSGAVDVGEPLIGVEVTSPSLTVGLDGNYHFTQLPVGDYVVVVVDADNVLNGHWHSLGTLGSDNHSQPEVYPVTIGGAAPLTNHSADFGYYRYLGSVGNRVWFDLNRNGVQDSAEPGINGLTVTLTIVFPEGTSIAMARVTQDDPASGEPGWYRFGNLLADENAAAAYTISAEADQFRETYTDTATDYVDADPLAGVSAVPQRLADMQQSVDADNPLNEVNPAASYDFGLYLADLGDLPDQHSGNGPQDYHTHVNDQGAEHVIWDTDGDAVPDIDGAVWLGAFVDGEPNGQCSIEAVGDDNDEGCFWSLDDAEDVGATGRAPQLNLDDEDGVVFPPLMPPATFAFPLTITVNALTVTQLADVGVWFDWDHDGSFDQFVTLDDVPPGTYNVLDAGALYVPASYDGGTIHVRVRVFSADYNPTMLDHSNSVVNGEVEDYVFPTPLYAVGNLLWIDGEEVANGQYNADADSVKAGVTLVLYNAVSNRPMLTTTTSTKGAYLFEGLPAGSYYILIPTEEFAPGGDLYDAESFTPYALSSANVYDDHSDDSAGHNGRYNPSRFSGVRSNEFVLGAADAPTGEPMHGKRTSISDNRADMTVDFAFYVADTTAVTLSQLHTWSELLIVGWLLIFAALGVATRRVVRQALLPVQQQRGDDGKMI